MTLRHLTVFYKVCEKMNMTAAAQELYISQPAVSQTISELEEYYRVPLFHRLSNRLYLTGAGEKLRDLTAQLLFWNAQIETTMKETRTRPPLKVGATRTAGEEFMTQLAAAYDRELGEVRTYLFTCGSREAERRLLNMELDLAFIGGRIYSKDIRSFPLYEDELVFVCAREHPLLEHAERVGDRLQLEPEHLRNASFLTQENGSGSRQAFEEAMHRCAIPYEIRGCFSGEGSILHAAAQSLGIGIVAGRSLRILQAESVAPFYVQGVSIPYTMKLAYHQDKFLFPEFQRFVAFSQSVSL